MAFKKKKKTNNKEIDKINMQNTQPWKTRQF